jgi:hypothetical protein
MVIVVEEGKKTGMLNRFVRLPLVAAWRPDERSVESPLVPFSAAMHIYAATP